MKKIYMYFVILIIIISVLLIYLKNSNSIDIEQLKEPKQGEEIAVINTNYGEIKIRLFDKIAPKAVDNFITQVYNGYYDRKKLSKVKKDNLVMLENPIEEDSMDTKYKDEFNDEYHQEYCHFRGAVGVAKFVFEEDGEIKRINSNTFYIVTKDYIDKDILEIMEDTYEDTGYSPRVVEAYKKHGGLYELDYEYTVFGQVYEGFNVLNEINSSYEGINDGNKEIPVIDNIKIIKLGDD